jgi:DNA-binding PadR family transcriptional regulator
MTGYELDKVFKDSLGFFWQGQTSQIYRELNAMEDAEWLNSTMIFQTDKPNRKSYSITESGREAFRQWLASSEESVDDMLHIRSAFLMRVFFAAELSKEQMTEMIRKFRDKCRQALQSMESIPENINFYRDKVTDDDNMFYWQMTALFGRNYYQAAVQWADEVLNILREKEGEAR